VACRPNHAASRRRPVPLPLGRPFGLSPSLSFSQVAWALQPLPSDLFPRFEVRTPHTRFRGRQSCQAARCSLELLQSTYVPPCDAVTVARYPPARTSLDPPTSHLLSNLRSPCFRTALRHRCIDPLRLPDQRTRSFALLLRTGKRRVVVESLCRPRRRLARRGWTSSPTRCGRLPTRGM
jgi:hypothetical protein